MHDRAHLGEWATVRDGGAPARVVGYLEQPSYTLETISGQRIDVAASQIESFRPVSLPTAPGFYVGDHHASPGGRRVVELLNSPAGQWVDCVDGQYLSVWDMGFLRDLHRMVEVTDMPLPPSLPGWSESKRDAVQRYVEFLKEL